MNRSFARTLPKFPSWFPSATLKRLSLEAVNMVRHDAPEVFEAIESANPYSSSVRRRFFELASALNAELADGPV